jgi:hypothetical protein
MSPAESQRPQRRRRQRSPAPLKTAPHAPSGTAANSPSTDGPAAASAVWSLRTRIACGLVVLAAGVWSYWPMLTELVAAWEREPDCSHGYLVVPSPSCSCGCDARFLASVRAAWFSANAVGRLLLVQAGDACFPAISGRLLVVALGGGDGGSAGWRAGSSVVAAVHPFLFFSSIPFSARWLWRAAAAVPQVVARSPTPANRRSPKK